MNEIKTGLDIYDAIDEATGNKVPELVKQKWISFDWLLEFLLHSRSLENAINDLKRINEN